MRCLLAQHKHLLVEVFLVGGFALVGDGDEDLSNERLRLARLSTDSILIDGRSAPAYDLSIRDERSTKCTANLEITAPCQVLERLFCLFVCIFLQEEDARRVLTERRQSDAECAEKCDFLHA